MGKKKFRKKAAAKRAPWEAPVQLVTVLATLALLGLGAYHAVQNYVYFAGFRPVLLVGDALDLRDSRISVEQYDELAARMPGAEILWSIPVSGQYFACDSERITLERLSEADIPLFSRFENLMEVYAPNCTDHEALAKLEQALPGVEVFWRVHLGGQVWDRDAELVDLENTDVTAAELEWLLPCFKPGVTVRLDDTDLTGAELESLKARFPALNVNWGVNLMGEVFFSSEKTLSFAGKSVDVQALIDAGNQFHAVEELDLQGCALTLDQLCAVQEAYPGAFIQAEFTLHGVTVNTSDTLIDLSGIKLRDTAAVEQAVKLMPNLEKVDMCDCGFTDEEMDALNKRYENIQFVWIVHFSIFELRTDAKAFCATNTAVKLRDRHLEVLKYCTDLVALDLSHMYYTNLSFLENMDKLEYLTLVGALYNDISVLANMENLRYLELFRNTLDDLTPLLECKNLRHLNIGYTSGFDYSPLKEMTWLERLWFPGHDLTKEQEAELRAALPNTEIYMPEWDPAGSTGGKWRESDAYKEMRDLIKMS